MLNNNNPKGLDLIDEINKFSIVEELIDEILFERLNKKTEDLILSKYKNLPNIILNDCEIKLKEKYNIPKNEFLIILYIFSRI